MSYALADEWDLDSWQRKFKHQHCVCVSPSGELSTNYIGDIIQDDDNIVFLDAVSKPIKDAWPIYFRVKSGWYNSKVGVVLILRKVQKTFGQGVSNANYLFYQLEDAGTLLDASYRYNFGYEFHKEPVFDIEQAMENTGPLNREFYLTRDGVYYFNQLIGTRYKRNLVVDEWISQEILDLTKGKECQVLV